MPIESRGRVVEIVDQDDSVAAPASDERLELVRALLASIEAAQVNEDALTAFSYSTSGTTAESLPSNAVPDGVSVVVQAQVDNSKRINVGNGTNQSIALDPGQSVSLAVTDTDLIGLQTPSTGDGVNVLYEG